MASRCGTARSEEHTSELQSQSNLVCRLLLEKKNPAASPLDRLSQSQRLRSDRPAADASPARKHSSCGSHRVHLREMVAKMDDVVVREEPWRHPVLFDNAAARLQPPAALQPAHLIDFHRRSGCGQTGQQQMHRQPGNTHRVDHTAFTCAFFFLILRPQPSSTLSPFTGLSE